MLEIKTSVVSAVSMTYLKLYRVLHIVQKKRGPNPLPACRGPGGAPNFFWRGLNHFWWRGLSPSSLPHPPIGYGPASRGLRESVGGWVGGGLTSLLWSNITGQWSVARAHGPCTPPPPNLNLNPEKLCWQLLPRPKKWIDFPFPLRPKLKIFRVPV